VITLNKVKNCILDFYKTNGKNIAMDFNYVVKSTGLSESDVDKALRQLLHAGFIKNPLFADNVPINFTI
jgi:predicted transcriptional regulator